MTQHVAPARPLAIPCGRVTLPLDRLIPPFFKAAEPQVAADEVDFDAYAGALARQLGALACGLMTFFILAWWPLDLYVIPQTENVEVFAALRVRLLVVVLTGLAVFGLGKLSGDGALLTATLCYAAFTAAIGYSLGAAGPAGLQWFADAAIALVPVAFIPLRLRARAVASTLVCMSLLASYFVPYPDNWATPGASSQVSFQVFALLLSVSIGELWLRVTRHAFFLQRGTARANADLELMTATLTQLVHERTRELEALARHLDALQESERRRIARDLHDDLGQGMTAMRYTLARLEARVSQPNDDLTSLVQQLSGLLDGSTQSLRAVVASLSPRVLEDHGLEAAAEWLVQRVEATSGVACVLESRCDDERQWERLDPKVALTVFRALQEVTNNALKHSGASSIHVALTLTDERVELSVTDDGRGFDASAETQGFGILGLRERVREGGGALRFEPEPGGGLKVTVSLPLSKEVAA